MSRVYLYMSEVHLAALRPLAQAEGDAAPVPSLLASIGNVTQAGGAPYAVVNGVAMVEVAGVLAKAPDDWFGDVAYADVQQALLAAEQDPAVSSIMIVLDSPGGTVAGVDDTAQLINQIEKPIAAYCQDLTASAAYYLASQCDAVFANAAAEVGCIGTVAAVVDWSRYFNDAGVKVHVVSTGGMKGAFTPGTEITAEQLADLQRVINGYGMQFTEAVANGRAMRSAEAQALCTGQVWLAEEAKQKRLVDEVLPLGKAIDRVRAMR